MYFTSQQLISTNPDLVTRFTEAMKESLAYADAHPDEVRDVLGTYTKIAPEVARGADPAQVAAGRSTARRCEALADLAVADGLLTQKPDIAALLP